MLIDLYHKHVCNTCRDDDTSRFIQYMLHHELAVCLMDFVYMGLINPRRTCAVRVTVLGLSFRLSVCLSVCYDVFCHYAQQGVQKAIPTGSVPHWLDFKNGDFHKSTAFKSYGVKTKRTSQYANEHGSDSARFSPF